jgi:hypothetical protein
MRRGSKCSVCGKMRDRAGQALCKLCHNAYMREWRSTHRLSPEQQRKSTARGIAKEYVKRGRILKTDKCVNCGSGQRVQFHHPDYSKPAEVLELCLKCHQEVHAGTVDITGLPFAPIDPNPKLLTCACGSPARRYQMTCAKCHAAYMRNWRKEHMFVKRSAA